MFKSLTKSLVVAASLLFSTTAMADDFVIDTQGAHSFIQFKVSHLGYSWLLGRFNTFEGEFSYTEDNPSDAKVSVKIETASIDSNHAERDKHLRTADFLDVSNHPEASFTSTGFNYDGDGKGTLTGDLSLRGVTKSIDIAVNHIGRGDDPWGNYRSGFEGTTTITMKDFGIPMDLGPASADVQLYLVVEGIRKK